MRVDFRRLRFHESFAHLGRKGRVLQRSDSLGREKVKFCVEILLGPIGNLPTLEVGGFNNSDLMITENRNLRWEITTPLGRVDLDLVP